MARGLLISVPMARTFLVVAVALALVCASSTAESARERNRPVRRVKARSSEGKTKPVVPAVGDNPLVRRGGTV